MKEKLQAVLKVGTTALLYVSQLTDYFHSIDRDKISNSRLTSQTFTLMGLTKELPIKLALAKHMCMYNSVSHGCH